MTAADPQGASDLAEDQLFALNPTLGMAFVLSAAGNGEYGAVPASCLGDWTADVVLLCRRSRLQHQQRGNPAVPAP